MTQRVRLQTDERREQLLRIGLDFFGSRPYGDVSTSDIAREAGVSHGLLFHYFGDKRRYYVEVLRSVADRLATAQVASEEDISAMERLRAALRAQVEFAESHTEAYHALISGGNGADAELAAVVEDARWRGIGLILDTLQVEQPDTQLRIALRGWQGFTEGAIVEWLKERDLPRDELVQLLAHELVLMLRRLGVDTSKAKRPAT